MASAHQRKITNNGAVMHIFIDESGNSGLSLFDESQPFFYSLAISCSNDFEKKSKKSMDQLRKQLGCTELHANRLGLTRINDISGQLLRILKDNGIKFFFVKIEKPYVALVRMFDCLFDPFDNKAVPWSAYNIEALRCMLLIKFSQMIDKEVLEKFWNSCLMEKKRDNAERAFMEVCNTLKGRLDEIVDWRSKKIISDALDWALEYNSEIVFSLDDNLDRTMGAANFIAITSLIPGTCDFALKKKLRIEKIIHDEQNQFRKSFEFYHDNCKNSKEFSFPEYFGTGKFNFLPISNCKFDMQPSHQSNGLQIVDVCLYLLKKELESVTFKGTIKKLVNYIKKKGKSYYYTYSQMEDRAIFACNKLLMTPLTEGAILEGIKIVREGEELRQKKNGRIQRANAHKK